MSCGPASSAKPRLASAPRRTTRSKKCFSVFSATIWRNPLNTVLTTARMMSMREDMAPEHEKKLTIVSSGVRMQRMIEQLLDVTRARLADGIPVRRGQKRDLVPLVIKIVDEIRAVHRTQAIEVVASPCMASIDPDRFEQVVSNMLANAAKHGDPDKPIRIELSTRGGLASISVHNRGVPDRSRAHSATLRSLQAYRAKSG